jgi:hypothetical protein
VIDEYVDSLLGALKHDRSLARHVRREVEDHLWEAVAADPSAEGPEAEQRAIASFGDPRVIAAQFAALSLAKHTRRTGAVVVLIIAGVFIAMKARLAWYTLMECAVSNDIVSVTQLVGSIDRYSFWLSVIAGVGCWASHGRGRFQASLNFTHRKLFYRFISLCAAAAFALVVSVTSDAVLTLLRLPGASLSLEFLIPTLSMFCEILGAIFLVLQIRATARRAATTRTMLEAV